MKKIFYALIAFCLCFTSCDELIDALAELTVFDIDYETEETIPATTVIIDSPLTIDMPTIITNSESRFENNETNADLLEKIRLKSMTLTVMEPTDGSFDFLEEITVSIKAEGLDRISIASKMNLQNDGSVILEMETTDTDLKEYIKRDAIDLRITAATDQTIPENYKIKAEAVFRVDAELFGL